MKDAGSRMHVLDWLESNGRDFIGTLNDLIAVTGAYVPTDGFWMPQGRHMHQEALLTQPCSPLLNQAQSAELRSWWLKVNHPWANEPNWDLAVTAVFPENRRGLVLVEAKAYVGELKKESTGKRLGENCSANSRSNHERIAECINAVRDRLGGESAGVRISRDSHYQFSNRIAFAAKLASEGIPCVLVYLGFTGDTGMGQDYLRDEQHWNDAVAGHIGPVFPPSRVNREFTIGSSSFWFLVRALSCARISPTKGHRPTLQESYPSQ